MPATPFHVGDVYVYQRGRWFHARGFHGGRAWFRALKVKDAAMARRIAERLNADLQTRRTAAATGSATMAFAVTEFLAATKPLHKPATHAGAELHLNAIRDYFGGATRLTALSQSGIAAYYRQLYADDLAAATVRGYHRTLHTFLAWCVRAGYATHNLASGMAGQLRKPDQRQIKAVDAAILDAFLGRVQRQDRCLWRILMIARYTGMRIAEILALEWADVVWSGGRVNVTHKPEIGFSTKGRQERWIPLLEPLRIALQSIRRRGRWVCVNEAGERIQTKPWKRMLAVMQKSERGVITFHCFRHTFASQLLSSGEVSLFEVSRILGHSTVAVTDAHYGHFVPLPALQKRMEDVMAGAIRPELKPLPKGRGRIK